MDQKMLDINERVANACVTIKVSISHYKGFKTFINGLKVVMQRSKIAEERERMSEIIAKITPFQKPIDKVTALQSLLQTYLYSQTFVWSDAHSGQQQKGERMVFATNALAKWNDLIALRDNVEVARLELAPKWDNLRQEVIDVASDLHIDISSIMISGDDLASRFITTVSNPRPIPPTARGNMPLPRELVEQFEREANEQLTRHIMGAKQQSLDDALEHFDLLVTQLATGIRLSPSLIDKAKIHCEKLKGMAEAYDGDIRILTAVETIETHLLNKTTEMWKADPAVRDESLAVAKNVRNNLKALSIAPTAQQVEQCNETLSATPLPVILD